MKIQLVTVCILYIQKLQFSFDEILTACDGQQGLDIFQRENPDIVLVDIVMPVMDGIEFARRALEIFSETKFIFY